MKRRKFSPAFEAMELRLPLSSATTMDSGSTSAASVSTTTPSGGDFFNPDPSQIPIFDDSSVHPLYEPLNPIICAD
jgi:hypothetical protein